MVATPRVLLVGNASRLGNQASTSTSTTSLMGKCQHNLLNKNQNAINIALESVLSSPPSAHQTSTVYALAEANTALIKCRDVLMWIYGEEIFLIFIYLSHKGDKVVKLPSYLFSFFIFSSLETSEFFFHTQIFKSN